MSADTDKTIAGITSGGCEKHGMAIMFTMEFSDGSKQTYHCRHDLFPLLMTQLTCYGAIAARARAAKNLEQKGFAAITPTEMRGKPGIVLLRGGRVVLEYATGFGFNVQLAMDRDQVRTVISYLTEALGQQPPIPGAN